MNFQRGRTPRRLIAIAILAGIALFRWLGEDSGTAGSAAGYGSTAVEHLESESDHLAGAQAIERAFSNETSGIWVESRGVVERLLPDDNSGSRHQKFILRLPTQRTVLISHNIDLAQRIPARPGDEVTFRGKYEWNQRGGVVHWTHHDPRARGRKEDSGGWLELGDTRVQ